MNPTRKIRKLQKQLSTMNERYGRVSVAVQEVAVALSEARCRCVPTRPCDECVARAEIAIGAYLTWKQHNPDAAERLETRAQEYVDRLFGKAVHSKDSNT